MLTTLGEDYILMAEAKGLPEPTIALRHALRNALLPIYTSLTLSLGVLASGVRLANGAENITPAALDFFEKKIRPVLISNCYQCHSASAKEVKAISEIGGVVVDAEVANRIANSIGPAFDGFAPVAGTLPFDLEPASFLLVQVARVAK